jgi:aminoglycoside phosphotransferase (APT) family kinase protein
MPDHSHAPAPGSPAPGTPVDRERLRTWLREAVDPSISAVRVTRLGGGHSSGAWLLDVDAAGGSTRLVLKVPGEPSVVFRRDAVREARIMDAAQRLGAPVPEVLAVDDGTGAVGRPCFAMTYVHGRAVADAGVLGYHDDEALRAAGPDAPRAVWESFHDSLAALHSVDARAVPAASLGDAGISDVIAYWRASLLDAVPAPGAPRQVAALDWLRDHLPAGADDAPAVCLGDARLVNGIVDGTQVRALVDFEVAYVGNPLADVAYSLMLDARYRAATETPLALPSPDETWQRWSRATERRVEHREYWTAFGMMIICITATRAMLQWGLAGDTVDSDNPMVGDWVGMIEEAAR